MHFIERTVLVLIASLLTSGCAWNSDVGRISETLSDTAWNILSYANDEQVVVGVLDGTQINARHQLWPTLGRSRRHLTTLGMRKMNGCLLEEWTVLEHAGPRYAAPRPRNLVTPKLHLPVEGLELRTDPVLQAAKKIMHRGEIRQIRDSMRHGPCEPSRMCGE